MTIEQRKNQTKNWGINGNKPIGRFNPSAKRDNCYLVHIETNELIFCEYFIDFTIDKPVVHSKRLRKAMDKNIIHQGYRVFSIKESAENYINKTNNIKTYSSNEKLIKVIYPNLLVSYFDTIDEIISFFKDDIKFSKCKIKETLSGKWKHHKYFKFLYNN